jgi:hypothetical protein
MTVRHLTPQAQEAIELRRQVAAVMADGRWRTAVDAGRRLGVKSQRVAYALAHLEQLGLLRSDVCKSDAKTKMYCKIGDAP